MSRSRTTLATSVIWAVLCAGGLVLAQEHMSMPMPMQHSGAAGAVATDESQAIFCPTMKTGQLCSHGTAAIFGLTGDKQEQWTAIARKYDRSVETATMELFKDSETVLTPQQQQQLKAWFAVGLNPEINQLLYTKGLGMQSSSSSPQKPAQESHP